MSEFEKNKNTENDVAVSGNTAELNNIVDSIINEICIDDDVADLEEFEEETITNDDIAKEIGTPEITDDLGKTKVLSVEDIKIEVIDEPIDAQPKNKETKTEDAIKEPAQEELVDVELTEEVGDSKHHKALNKEFLENLEKKKVSAPIDESTDVSEDESTKVLDFKISDKYKTKVLPNTDQIEIDESTMSDVDKKEIKRKRKEKVKDFVLVRQDEEDEYDDDEVTEYTEIGQAKQVLHSLNKLKLGLVLRLIVLIVTSFTLFYISFAYDNQTLYLPEFISKSSHVGYISFNAILGIISCMAAMPVIIGGIRKIFTLKADEDSICALSMIISIGVSLYFLVISDSINKDNINNFVLYISVATVGLLINTIGKIISINRIKRNFKFISGASKKYSIDIIDDEDSADAFTKGSLVDFPQLSVMHETEFLTDFLKTSKSNTYTYKIGRILLPVSVVIALVLSIACGYIHNDLSLALSAFAGAICVASPFSLALITAIPLSKASVYGASPSSIIASYSSAEKFADTNSVLLNASDLFPDGSIRLVAFKIFGNKKPDDAVLYASSLCIQSQSVLSHIFYDIIGGKVNLLRKVENFVYEDSMGMSAWIDNKRVLMGSRELMKNHGISIPTLESERKYIKNDGIKVVYISVSGEVIAVFHIEMKASLEISDQLHRFEKNNINIVLKTVDSVITVSNIAEIFSISPNSIKTLPFRLHNEFDRQISYRPQAVCDAACDGKFSNFASVLVSSKRIRKSVRFSTAIHIASMILGVFLFGTFALLSTVGYFTPSSIIIYYLAWLFITAIIGLDV